MTPPRPRPLSPHLQVYKLSITMAMSIAHRITGAAAYLATALLAIYLVALASGEQSYTLVAGIYGSAFGRLILFLVTFAAVHHSFGGLRHLVWDLGYGLKTGTRQMLAAATLVGSAAVTVLIWLIVLLR